MRAVTAATPSHPAGLDADRAVAIWLFLCCAMIFVMVVLGGVTRLTHSGLSIVEWQPLFGWIPPLSDAAWQDAFRKYQATPEFEQLNHAMTLAQFKPIFWMEYTHRLWGRLIGVVFLVPFAVFAAQRRIAPRLRPRLVAIFVLGLLQGGMGWYMVKSGLVQRPDVSQYRLAAHLGIAFVIYAYIFWLALDLAYGGTRDRAPANIAALRRHASALAALVFVTALAGAIVAGTDAGFAYNTFPLMDGRIVPEGMFELSPWYLNFFENIAAVQFAHRAIALTTFALIVLFWFEARRVSGSARVAVNHLGAFAVLQVALGISTLLLAVPVPLAAAHQAGALLLFTSALWTAHRLRHAA
jgi:cytochrome c oxidase assembly protein subunit 15